MLRILKLHSLFCICILVVDLANSRPLSAPVDNTERAQNHKFFEGDIRLVDGDKPYGYRKRRQSDGAGGTEQPPQYAETMADPGYFHIWPNQTIYYTFAQALSDADRRVYQEAIDEWSQSTCLNFVLATDEHQNHIIFIRSNDYGCSSLVGMKGGPQIVSMSDTCFSRGHAMHEIGHALGLWHEHSRPDRDEYIEVMFENIIQTEQDNFGKLTDSKFRLVPDVGYDIESIMHYGPYAFAEEENGPAKRTIKLREDAPLDYKYCRNLLAMGQRSQLSYLDRLRVNRLYSCTAQINQLVAEGRECLLPVTTPTPTTTVPMTTAMPSPTTTQSVIPTPSPPSRLKSGSVITLRVERPGDHNVRGVKCTPTCRADSCYEFNGKSTCDFLDYQFEIIVRKNPDAKKVKSGDEVALRWRRDPTHWLDCSNGDSACSTTRCVSNDADSISNVSVSTCSSHHFKIIGVDRREGRLLNTNHSIQLKHESNQSFLNCNDNNKCKFSSEEASFKFHIQQ